MASMLHLRLMLLTAMLIVMGCAGRPDTGPGSDTGACPGRTLRLYTSWPMQGGMTAEGAGMKNGVDLAVAEVAGAVAGYCLEVINLDGGLPETGRWDGAVEERNARKAVADPLAIVYIGTYNSGAARVSMPITNRAHMAMISPANTYPGLTKRIGAAPGEPEVYRPMGLVNYFRVSPADNVQGAAAARWAKARGHKKIFILNDRQLYGIGLAAAFRTAAEKIALEVVANEGIDWQQADQRPILARVKASGADLVYHGALLETGAPLIVRQMRDLGLVAARGVKYMGPDGLYEDEFLKAATCEALTAVDFRMTFGSLPFENMKGIGALTYESYKKTFGKEPTGYALYAAEAGRVAVDAIRRAAPDIDKAMAAKDIRGGRDAVRRAIAATKDFDGIIGKWSFDDDGDTTLGTTAGFKVEKDTNPIGCRFAFEVAIE